ENYREFLDYAAVGLDHLINSIFRKQKAQKRGGGKAPISFEDNHHLASPKPYPKRGSWRPDKNESKPTDSELTPLQAYLAFFEAPTHAMIALSVINDIRQTK